MSYGNFKPTDQAIAFKQEVTQKIDEQLNQYQQVVKNDLPKFNQLVREKSIDAVTIDQEITELEGTYQ